MFKNSCPASYKIFGVSTTETDRLLIFSNIIGELIKKLCGKNAEIFNARACGQCALKQRFLRWELGLPRKP
jgi:hypothetical protein